MGAAPFSLTALTAANQATFLTLVAEYYAYDGIPFVAAKAQQALETLLQTPTLGVAWLVMVGTEVAGYVVVGFGFGLESGGRDAILDELYLRSPYRGQGWGKALIALVEDYCRTQGCQMLYLVVEPHNTRAQAVYRQLAFELSDRLIFAKSLRAWQA
ncbi:MAG: GNAT family N-acetyltransferase [Leptolyngbya sp.]|nr:GNAT family N-acetyltransferase [Leptolyngbya sp.]